MNKNKIWLSSPHMGGNERNYVNDAFDTNWIAPLGPHVNAFEEVLSNYLSKQGESLGTAVLTSGTAGIHLAMVMLDVKAGDYVICQSFTFCGTTNPIVYQGAIPVMVDSEPDTWNMNPEALREAIKDCLAKGKKPKAIMPVHLYGMPAKMDEINNIAAEYDIPVVEDAAEALGSTYKGKACGSLGKISILSFNGNKIITTSGGGALVSVHSEYVTKARFLSTQARDNAPHYQHSHIGYNYRMSNVLAGIGRGQMEVLDERVSQRRKNNIRYRDYFNRIAGIQFQNEPNDNYFSNYWLSAILVNPDETGGITREDIRLSLESENIEARPLWKPMHMQPIFEGCLFYGDGTAARLFEQGLCLPSGSNLSMNDFERVFAVLDCLFTK
jgi:dTDP-4-amino-4,6-dideoxygalactose transaminase